LQSLIENRAYRLKLYDFIQSQLNTADLDERQMALALIKFKDLSSLEVNLGFYALEEISKCLFERLVSITKNHDLVLQTSIDTFLLVVPKVLNHGHAKLVANRISDEMKRKIQVEQDIIQLESLIGIAISGDVSSGESLYKNALIAIEKGILSDKNYALYEPVFSQQLKKNWDLKNAINIALHENQFELYFQPKISLKENKVLGGEALIRWNHPQHGLVAPNDFIPVAEESGQIKAITDWVIKSSIRLLSSIIKSNPEFKLSINISANNLGTTELVIIIEDMLLIWDVPANNLILEITETAIIKDTKSTLHQLEIIRAKGVGVSIDDFGTGYSSLSYFKHLPVTEIKIDKSFIDNLLDDNQDEKIIALIISLAKQFELDVVAEGVENKATLEQLKVLGCDLAQGYYFSKPLPFDEFVDWNENFVSVQEITSDKLLEK